MTSHTYMSLSLLIPKVVLLLDLFLQDLKVSKTTCKSLELDLRVSRPQESRHLACQLSGWDGKLHWLHWLHWLVAKVEKFSSSHHQHTKRNLFTSVVDQHLRDLQVETTSYWKLLSFMLQKMQCMAIESNPQIAQQMGREVRCWGKLNRCRRVLRGTHQLSRNQPALFSPLSSSCSFVGRHYLISRVHCFRRQSVPSFWPYWSRSMPIGPRV